MGDALNTPLRGWVWFAVLPRTCLLLIMMLMPVAAVLGTPLSDEIGGDNFDGFDLTPCDGNLTSDSFLALDYAAALDLCATTTEGSHAPGLISATLTHTDGSGSPNAASRSIRPQYGTGTTPRRGSRLVLLSTGTAAAPSDTSPSFVDPQAGPGFGFSTGTSSALPADWLSAHGNAVPNLPACPAIQAGTAYDPVMLTLHIRVPNNAHSFRLDASFFASDYPEWACSDYNDIFVALLKSDFGDALNPPDRNLASFDGAPTSVNLALLQNGPFLQCVNGPTGCLSASPGISSSCLQTSQLVGTGMDASPASAADACNTPGGQVGGATGWFVMRGNVVPGDVIELRLAIWDSGDGTYDSDVALDDFRWSYQSVEAGATPEAL